jgi:hypothetical protein
MKLKMIAAALVLATSGSAHALIVDGSTGNGELFMTVLDAVGQKSYTLDLNLTMNDFLSGVAANASYNYAADANMTSFLSTAAGPLVWAIGAMDAFGANASDYHRYISTASTINLASTVTNDKLKLLGARGAELLGDTNADIGGNASLIVIDPSRLAYADSASWGSNWGGAANFTATGAIGDSMNLYLARQSSGAFAARNSPSIYQALSFNGNAYQATLDMSGNLQVAAVPEPETYALMLAGLGLVGFMARRRKA